MSENKMFETECKQCGELTGTDWKTLCLDCWIQEQENKKAKLKEAEEEANYRKTVMQAIINDKLEMAQDKEGVIE